MALLSFSNCQLATSFINKFLLQIIGPPIFIFAVFLAWLVVKIVRRTKKDGKQVETARRGQALQLVIIIIQLLFPKLSTFTFQMFRCLDLAPISSNQLGLLLDADLSVTCFEGVHAEYVWFAVGSIVLFLIGIPLVSFVLLYRNRKHLHLASVRAEYGDLYKPYEDHW
jgi:membrane protein implicated in regulation of membrane protease activity